MSIIEDGTGNKYRAKVSSANRLQVTSKCEPLQNVIASEYSQAYQILSTTTITGSGRFVGLHIKNSSTNYDITLTYIRHQLITGSGLATGPDENSYFYTGTGRTYQVNGSAKTAVNTTFGSTNLAEITSYSSNPTLAGTLVELDRNYPQDRGVLTYNKEGSVIIKPQQTIEVGFNTNYSTGSFYSRISFLMIRI